MMALYQQSTPDKARFQHSLHWRRQKISATDHLCGDPATPRAFESMASVNRPRPSDRFIRRVNAAANHDKSVHFDSRIHMPKHLQFGPAVTHRQVDHLIFHSRLKSSRKSIASCSTLTASITGTTGRASNSKAGSIEQTCAPPMDRRNPTLYNLPSHRLVLRTAQS